MNEVVAGDLHVCNIYIYALPSWMDDLGNKAFQDAKGLRSKA